eukprot:2831894-Pyramimonas_sp.AAC.1
MPQASTEGTTPRRNRTHQHNNGGRSPFGRQIKQRLRVISECPSWALVSRFRFDVRAFQINVLN